MSWAEKELSGISLGDKRLENRSIKLLDALGSDPSSNIPEACGGWAESKAAYRFFENESVTAEKLLQPHKDSTLKRMKEHKVVLLIQDTTQLNYSTQHQKEGIGPLKNKHHRGILLHPTIAVTPERLCLGIIDNYHWHRDRLHNITTKEKNRLNLKKPITEKESYRWITGYQKASALCSELPDTQFINISDREGDIYDMYHEAFSSDSVNRADYLIRAVKNRPLLDKATGKKSELNIWETTNAEPIKGYIQFTLPKRGNQPSRNVKQALKAKSVWLNPPAPRKGINNCGPVQVNAVIATEINPPEGVKPIEWLFITSLPIQAAEQLELLLQYYLCRWQIEIFFRVLKSGCRVEKLQLTTQKRLDACLAMYFIITWRILFITILDRENKKSSCDLVFSRDEWELLYIMSYKKKPPIKPPELHLTVKMLAKLGGFLNRKSDKYPGPMTIWKGLSKLREAVLIKSSLMDTYG